MVGWVGHWTDGDIWQVANNFSRVDIQNTSTTCRVDLVITVQYRYKAGYVINLSLYIGKLAEVHSSVVEHSRSLAGGLHGLRLVLSVHQLSSENLFMRGDKAKGKGCNSCSHYTASHLLLVKQRRSCSFSAVFVEATIFNHQEFADWEP